MKLLSLRLIGIPVLIVLFLTAVICFGQNTAEQIVAKGVEYAADGKFQEAKEEFEKALKVDPSAKRYLEIIQEVIDQRVRTETAIIYFRGLNYAFKEQYSEAITEYDKAIEVDPQNAYAFYSRGTAYGRKGQYDEAISDFSKAIEINPRDAWAYGNRGNAYADKGLHNQAISDFNRAIEINPRDAKAYNNRGVAFFHKREYEKAWDDVYKVQDLGYEVHPDFLKALREASGREI